MQKTLVLLVGINDYPSPIRALGGCLKDLDNIETYLKTNAGTETVQSKTIAGLAVQQYGALQICRLENEGATYDNICKGFEQFLQQATPEDVVWFHFSGHGAEQPTAKEFLSIEPNGKDQTLVCYQHNNEAFLHLADKELAVLLHKIAAFTMDGQPKKSPHIIVTLDCCHSGSGTRDLVKNADFKSRNLLDNLDTRMSMTNTTSRLLSTYANGFYREQLAQKSRLEIPLAKHVLFSACESVQEAGDLPAGGIFTSGLVTALTTSKGAVNYADLYIKLRATVQKIRPEQSPQLEPLGNFNLYTCFLNGVALGTPNRFEILQKGEKWFVKCGTIHGLAPQTQPIEIQSIGANSTKVGLGQLMNVGGLQSEFEWTEGQATDLATNYRAVIPTFITNPIVVGLTGDAIALAKLKTAWKQDSPIQWTEDVSTKADWVLEVIAKEEVYDIYNHRRNTKALTWPQSKDQAAIFILDSLVKIAKWERMLTLNKPNAKITDWVDFELGVMDKSQKITYDSNPKIIIEATAQNCFEKEGALVMGFFPQVKIKHTRRNIYCYLFNLRTNYSIQSEEGAVIYRPQEYSDAPTIPLVKKPKAWGLAANDKEVTTWFKLIITTEPIEHHQFLQSDLLGDRAVRTRRQFTKVMNEWYSRTIQVVMKRV